EGHKFHGPQRIVAKLTTFPSRSANASSTLLIASQPEGPAGGMLVFVSGIDGGEQNALKLSQVFLQTPCAHFRILMKYIVLFMCFILRLHFATPLLCDGTVSWVANTWVKLSKNVVLIVLVEL
ncbi:hypothetical protein CFOL_v3_07781, partial [Cephalotus follicularis]